MTAKYTTNLEELMAHSIGVYTPNETKDYTGVGASFNVLELQSYIDQQVSKRLEEQSNVVLVDSANLSIEFTDLVQLTRGYFSTEKKKVGYAQAAKAIDKAIEPHIVQALILELENLLNDMDSFATGRRDIRDRLAELRQSIEGKQ